MSSDGVSEVLERRLSSVVISISIADDRLGCGDCGGWIDTSDVETERQAIATMDRHVEENHD